ncbi:MAG: efflux RND transporter permease subunit [Armatimonadetes bacterium]|nr:efflux RND transporter permease subunit [Armatimonadota bacterium]
MKLTDWAIRNIRPIVFLTTILCLAGAAMYASFPVSILPDVTFPRVVVVAEAGSRPTKVVDVTVTAPLEEAFATIPNVKRIRSKTKPGSTEISVDFLDGTDVIRAEQLVNAKVNEVRPLLPPETLTEVERMNPTVFPVLGLTVKSKSLTQTELWSLARYTLRPRLARVDGVARVVVQGGRPPEIAVTLRPTDMAAAGVTNTEVVSAIQASNIVRAVGRIDHEFKQYQVLVDSERQSAADIAKIVVGQRNGAPIQLSDIATVQPSTEDRTTIVSANGKESVLINIIRQPSANSVAMVDAVNQELQKLRSSLPSDVEVGLYYDQSVLIKEAVSSVRDAVIIGAILSVFVLTVFLRNVRATVVTASIIPITLLVTFVLMRLSGLTLNLMTLGALAVGIGLVIDDAIVVVEAVFRHLGPDVSVKRAVQEASSHISAPMVSSTLTTVVVFLPLAFLQGVAGAFFMALALTLTIALLVSLALALCVSPSLCAGFLRYSHGLHEEGRFFTWVTRRYEASLRWMLKHRWIVLPIGLVTILGTVFMAGRLQSGFMPEIDEGAFVLDYWSPPGTSLDESDRLLSQVDKILEETPEISSFSRRTGTELGFAITETNRGDYAVMLKPNRNRSIDDVISEVRAKVQQQVPSLDVDFIQVLQDLIGDLAGNPDPIEIRVFGENKQDIESLADKLVDKLSNVKGLADVKSGAIESGPQMQFVPNDVEIGRRGMNSDELADQLNASLLGTVATEVVQGDRQIAVRVRLPIANRSTLKALETLPVSTPSGIVQLGDLGEIKLIPGTTQSTHEDQRRLVAVTARLEGVDLGTAVKEVKGVLAQVKPPPGVTLDLAGQYLSQQDSFRNLTLVLAASVILVFSVMLFQFRRFEAPTIILLLMPLAMFGAVLALWITGTALNVSSFMGVIMLAGIVVKNGILLLDQAQNAWEKGESADVAVISAGRTRLRPILMTTLTAVLGLLPLAFGIGAGAEMQKPLAVAVVGGLLFSTLITLLLGPTIYAAVLRRKKSIQETD